MSTDFIFQKLENQQPEVVTDYGYLKQQKLDVSLFLTSIIIPWSSPNIQSCCESNRTSSSVNIDKADDKTDFRLVKTMVNISHSALLRQKCQAVLRFGDRLQLISLSATTPYNEFGP